MRDAQHRDRAGFRTAYLCIPVHGERDRREVYDRLLWGLCAGGVRPLNLGVVGDPPAIDDSRYSAAAIAAENLLFLTRADVVVAEVSRPSLGVGYEIAHAERLGKPVIGLWRSGSVVSKSIFGSQYRGMALFEYGSVEDIDRLIPFALRWSLELERQRVERATNRTAMVAHFEELAPKYHFTAQWRRDANLLGWFTASCGRATLCVDIGSGTGMIAEAVSSMCNALVRVDLSAQMLRQGRVGDAVVADAVRLPVRNGAADLVVCRQLLHYTDEQRIVDELARVLRPGGRLLIAQVVAPDDCSARWWQELKRMTQPLRRSFFTVAHLSTVFEAGGFTTRETELRFVPRSDPWKRFLCEWGGSKAKELVEAYFDLTPPSLQRAFGLTVDDKSVTYRQCWGLLSFERNGAKPDAEEGDRTTQGRGGE